MRETLIRSFRSQTWRSQACCIVGLALIISLVIWGRVNIASSSTPVRLVVYAFSSQEEALTQAILPDFERAWEAESGRELSIECVFGPSGTMAGQINLGAPADVVLFSNVQHVNWLKLGKQVKWETDPLPIGVTPIVIVTRPGNPASIADFSDLAETGLMLLHPDPRSSGAGEWAVLAEYGSALRQSESQAAARARLQSIWRNVRVLGTSARASMTLFEMGAGDAFLTYEQEARLAQDRGVALEIVIPERTILAEHVAVVVDANVTPGERPVAQAFLDYLTGEKGQATLSRYHMRPISGESPVLPSLDQPFTVEDMGGWAVVYTDLVETLWKDDIEPGLQLAPTRLPKIGGE